MLTKLAKSREELHRELWVWVSKNPGLGKDCWPGWGKYDIYYADRMSFLNQCFACGESNGIPVYENIDFDCSTTCPLNWGNGRHCNNSYNTLFRQWEEETDLYKLYVLALKIAFMKWNKKEKNNGK